MRDNIHFTFREIDGYNKSFNAIISTREAGKSTAVWLDKAYKAFKEGYTTFVVRRHVADLTEAYIISIEEIINEFYPEDNIKLVYSKSEFKSGIVYIYINDKIFICLFALSIKVERIKSNVLRNVKYGIFDEFIINPEFGEKYLKNEASKFREAYNTFYREAKKNNTNLKVYFLGNPYSLYNPYFEWWKVQINNFKPGDIQYGDAWCVQNYKIKDELKQQILKTNPLYKFDEDNYSMYALDGLNVNDNIINIQEKRPLNYYLYIVFRIEGNIIGIFKARDMEDGHFNYYVQYINDFKLNENRTVLCFDFSDIIDGTILYRRDDNMRIRHFSDAMRYGNVKYNEISIYWKMLEIYKYL